MEMTEFEKHYLNPFTGPYNVLEYITYCMRSGRPFVFTKMGDGELLCMRGQQGRNCDGSEYLPGLQDDLKKAYKYLGDHHAFIAPWSIEQDIFGEQIRAWEDVWGYKPWVDGDMLLHTDGPRLTQTINFWKAVRDSKRIKVFIGAGHLTKMQDVLKFNFMYRSHPSDSYLYHEDAVGYLVNKIPDNGILVTSCGMSAKVIIHKVLEQRPNITAIDAGSSFDPLCGRRSRSGQIKDITAEELYG